MGNGKQAAAANLPFRMGSKSFLHHKGVWWQEAVGKKYKATEKEKEAIPCVMKCIEILFVAYYIGINDTKRADDAM